LTARDAQRALSPVRPMLRIAGRKSADSSTNSPQIIAKSLLI
jgi:hypothetical protein